MRSDDRMPVEREAYRKTITVAVVNFHTVWGDKKANLNKMKDFIEKAATQGVELILFPECALTGYEPDPEGRLHKELAEPIPGPSTEEIASLARRYNMYVVFGMPERDKENPSTIYNSAAIVGPKRVLGSYRKVHPWIPELSWCVKGSSYPVFETDYGPIGIAICYDNYFFPEVARIYALKGVRLLLNPTAMPNYHGWELFDCMVNQLRARSIENLFYVASANLVGREVNLEFLGGSLITGPRYPAVTYMYAGPGSRKDEEILIAKLNFEELDKIRKAIPCFTDRRPDTYGILSPSTSVF